MVTTRNHTDTDKAPTDGPEPTLKELLCLMEERDNQREERDKQRDSQFMKMFAALTSVKSVPSPPSPTPVVEVPVNVYLRWSDLP
jgi:hypothetical protein